MTLKRRYAHVLEDMRDFAAIGRWTSFSSRVREFLDTNPIFVERRRETFRALLAGNAEAREEENVAGDTYTGPLIVVNVPKLHTL